MPFAFSSISKTIAMLLFSIAGLAPVSVFAEMDMPHMHMDHEQEKQACSSLTLDCAATSTPFIAPNGDLWIAARSGNRIFVTRSKDHGQTFSPAVPIDVGAVTLDWGPDARPKIVIDRNGAIIIAYAIFRDQAFNGEVFVTRSTDGGQTFTPVKPITDIQESQRFADMAFNSHGDLFAVWLDKRNRAAARAKGKNYVGAGLAFSWSRDLGQTFAPAVIAVDDTCECCRLALAFNSADLPVVLFRNIFPGGMRDHAIITFEGQQQPGDVRRVSADNWATSVCPHQGPSLAIAEDGSYHTAWFTQGKERQGLFYARSTDQGVHFSNPMALGPEGAILSRPSVLATGKVIRLSWKAFDGKRTAIMLMTSLDGGTTWGQAKAITETAGSSDHPLLVAEKDRAYLSWQTQDGYRYIALDSGS